MSRKANPYDDALAESFVATLKTECFADWIPPTKTAAKLMAPLSRRSGCFRSRFRHHGDIYLRRRVPIHCRTGFRLICVEGSAKRRGHGRQLGVKNNRTEYRTMTQGRINKGTQEIKAMMAEDADFYVPLCAP